MTMKNILKNCTRLNGRLMSTEDFTSHLPRRNILNFASCEEEPILTQGFCFNQSSNNMTTSFDPPLITICSNHIQSQSLKQKYNKRISEPTFEDVVCMLGMTRQSHIPSPRFSTTS
mmetsp:Transcript_7562/g.15470  ORF Transcript_7562/g.15470 Transcript_7562/m.15470 type:complete len:116 (+) Transcript_7562:3-350(+)